MKNWYYDTRLSGKLQEKIKRFSQKVTRGFNKPDRKWVSEVIYGILKSKDVKLTNIGRALKEDTRLKHTEKRLSRNLIKKDISYEIMDSYIPTVVGKIRENTILALDLSDISKKEAKKMDYLCQVWDGSEATIADKGYWICKVVGKNLREKELIPLYEELFSTIEKDFCSENKQILKAIRSVTRHIGEKGIWVIDRGGDRRRIFDPLIDDSLNFIIRLNLRQRHIKAIDGTKDYPIEIAKKVKLHNRTIIQGKQRDSCKTYHVRFGYTRVFLPWRGEEITMVIAKGFGKKPLLLLADVEVRGRSDALWVIESYISRWVIEESFRFIKQAYCLEDIRLQRYNGLKNMVAIMLLVYGFLSVGLLLYPKMWFLVNHIYERAKRMYGIADYPFYALADGIFYLLAYYREKFTIFEEEKINFSTVQLVLFANLEKGV